MQGEDSLFRTIEDRKGPLLFHGGDGRRVPVQSQGQRFVGGADRPGHRQGDVGVEHGGEDIRAALGHPWPLAGEDRTVDLVAGQDMAENLRILVDLVDVAHVEGIS